MKRKAAVYTAFAAVFLLLAGLALALKALGRMPDGPLGGLMAGGGVRRLPGLFRGLPLPSGQAATRNVRSL